MNHPTRERVGPGAEAGFTLVEALVAVVVLVFGLLAVTNLLLVAASSNSVANQSTAAVASASRAMDMLRATTYSALTSGGSVDSFDATAAATDCSDPALALSEWAATRTCPASAGSTPSGR